MSIPFGDKISVWSEYPLRLRLGLGCMTLAFAAGVSADPLSSPSMSGPLAPNANPASFDAGPLGKVHVTGQLTGLGWLQNHTVPAPGSGNEESLVDLSNAQIELQTTSGPLQLYVQGGAYALPSLGAGYLQADEAGRQLYGVLPVAYAKLALTPQFSVQVGKLPTLIGAEATFSFQNMNIERGLLWNQEPAISRGVQLNYSRGPIAAAVSLNDGFYSDRYGWVSGSVSYALSGANTVTLVAAGNTSEARRSSFATPVAQNNSSIYNIIYTYSRDRLTVSPYLQYTRVGRDADLQLDTSASTFGATVLVKYTVSDEVAFAARAEYIQSDAGDCATDVACDRTNLLYGADSGAWSLTLTPTWQQGVFFVRGEISYTRISDPSAGAGFGERLDRSDQVRALLETGVLF